MTKTNPRRFTDQEASSYGFPYGSQEWLEALDFPPEARAEVSKNRARALALGHGRPDADQIRGFGDPLSIGTRGGVYRWGRSENGYYKRYV